MENCTWEDFEKGMYLMKQWAKNYSFNGVYGIPRGGLILAVRLSHLLDIPLLTELDSKNVLVVDDIADSGKTLSSYQIDDCKTATLYYHRKSKIIPNFWAYEKKDKWIVFPWEVL